MFGNKMNANPEVFIDEACGLLFTIESVVNSVNTADIVKVIAVDTSKKTVDVIPMVSTLNASGEKEPLGNIYGIKYIQWQFGENVIEATPKEGDVGLLVICKKDISSIESGVIASKRKYCPADGIYIGGLCGFNESPKQIIKFDDTGITIQTDKSINVKSTTMVNVNAPSVNIGVVGGTMLPVARDGDTVMAGQTVIGTIKASSVSVNAT